MVFKQLVLGSTIFSVVFFRSLMVSLAFWGRCFISPGYPFASVRHLVEVLGIFRHFGKHSSLTYNTEATFVMLMMMILLFPHCKSSSGNDFGIGKEGVRYLLSRHPILQASIWSLYNISFYVLWSYEENVTAKTSESRSVQSLTMGWPSSLPTCEELLDDDKWPLVIWLRFCQGWALDNMLGLQKGSLVFLWPIWNGRFQIFPRGQWQFHFTQCFWPPLKSSAKFSFVLF